MFLFCHVYYDRSLMYFQDEIGGEADRDQEGRQTDMLLRGQIGNLIDLLRMAGSLLAAGS